MELFVLFSLSGGSMFMSAVGSSSTNTTDFLDESVIFTADSSANISNEPPSDPPWPFFFFP